VHNTLPQPRQGTLRTQKKVILNEKTPTHLEVAIGEIEVIYTKEKDETHYIVSFGGDKSVKIIGKDNWNKFVDMIYWLDWDPKETQEFYINPDPETYNHTLEYETIFFDDDEEIIDGMPIEDDK